MPSLGLLPAWTAGDFSALKEGAALTSRTARTSHVPATYQEGQLIEVTTVDVAHGGWCVARPDEHDRPVVRHALPGETVRAKVTDVDHLMGAMGAQPCHPVRPHRELHPRPPAQAGARLLVAGQLSLIHISEPTRP